jgi:quinol monooxygenase YgiN
VFGLCVRFTCKDETSAEAYDRLVAETVEAVKTGEPGTLVYAAHLVDGQPLQRIFYELYRDEAHSRSMRQRCTPAATSPSGTSTWPTLRWMAELQTGKGTGG